MNVVFLLVARFRTLGTSSIISERGAAADLVVADRTRQL